MLIAIVSDIHANYPALRAVLEDARGFPVDRWFCLGDTVGYGPDPVECLDWARTNCQINLLGNHDAAVADIFQPEGWLREEACFVIRHHQEALSADARKWLADRPVSFQWREFDGFLVHGAPGPYPYMEYFLWDVLPTEVFDRTPEKMIILGHTHIPCLYQTSDSFTVVPVVAAGAPIPDHPVYLEDNRRTILNPGSVGQPRDEDPRASYVLLDTEARALTFRRVPYDIMATQRRMKECGYPPFLWERLQYGR